MLGRGIVHPLDMQHSDNPPVQSELLDLLADELVRTKYDLRGFLREVALTRAYQRSSFVPEPSEFQLDPGAVSPRLTAWKSEAQRLADEQTPLEQAMTDADVKLSEAYDKYSAAAARREAAEKARGEVKKASDELAAALAAAIKDEATKDDVLKSLVAAREAAAAAAKKLPDDKALAEAAGTIKTRAGEVEAALAAARKTIATKKPEVQAASLKLAEADKTLQTATAEVTTTTAGLEAAEAAAGQAAGAFRAARSLANELKARIEDAERAVAYGQLAATAEASRAAAQSANEQLATLNAQKQQDQESVTADELAAAESVAQSNQEKAAADEATAHAAWDTLVERSTARFTLGPLKPLSPEQLAWATMQAVGLVEREQQAQAPEAKKQAEAAGEMTPEARSAWEAKRLEELVDAKLAGNVKPFVELFAQQPGQAPTFQATVHQALFLANGGLLAGWLNPGGGNLTERLSKLSDPAAVADELYLSVFTRRPTPDEAAEVAEYWQTAEADRAAAAREMVWSLLTSSEFRFNH